MTKHCNAFGATPLKPKYVMIPGKSILLYVHRVDYVYKYYNIYMAPMLAHLLSIMWSILKQISDTIWYKK